MPPKASPPVASLEVGTTKVRVLVGEYRPDGQLIVTGLGECLSRGVRKSEIVDINQVLPCIQKAVREAENTSRVSIHRVHMAVSGAHIKSTVNKGEGPVRNANQIVTMEDVEEVKALARAVMLPDDRVVLHSVVQRFVAGEVPTTNPEGMSAATLSLKMLIMHGSLGRLNDLWRVARDAHVVVEDSAFSTLAAAKAVLTAEQKESGVLIIEMGAGTTGYLVYADKVIAHAAVLGVGGDHVTNDLMIGLKIPSVQAEKLKLSHGSAIVDLSRRNQTESVPGEAGFESRQVRVNDIQTITNARLEEMFELIKRDLERLNLRHHLGAGVVLTGGVAHTPEIIRLAERIFGLPAAVGVPRGFGGLTAETEKPEFATAIGLLKLAQRSVDKYLKPGLLDRFLGRIGGRR